MKKQMITIENRSVSVRMSHTGSDYVSLTDMAKYIDTLEPRIVVQNWLRTRYAIDFIGSWEMLCNPEFNRIEFDAVKLNSGENSFTMSPEKWIRLTGGIKTEN